MDKNVVTKIDDLVNVKTVLISVSDKTGLDAFIPQLVDLVPDITILSTGGTYNHLKDILGPKYANVLTQVSDYTGQPETQGGLVKTLDFKIYLGLLTETYNENHQNDLQRTQAVAVDMAVVNLYPFRETIAKAGATPENARGNIDIGGPCMIRAAAKNFIRVASVVNPSDYSLILDELESCQGKLPLKLRYALAQKAFAHTAEYDAAIATYLGKTGFEKVLQCYQIKRLV